MKEKRVDNFMKLDLKEAQQRIKCKDEMYVAVQLANYFLPKQTSSIVNSKFLKEIRKQQVWCPKYDELKMKPCPNPPPRSLVIVELKKACI